jgi:hypothetical protein
MKDIKQRIEKLLIDAEDCAIISKLATIPAKREAFQKLADDYRRMAQEMERVVDQMPTRVRHFRNTTQPK